MQVTIETVLPRTLAAVRRRVKLGEVGMAWKPALDQVWAFLRARPGVRTGGHNVFLYHHPDDRAAAMDVDFGVEVSRPFQPEGEIILAEVPAGEVAMAVHRGAYDRLRHTHDAVHAWQAGSDRRFAGRSWEIYGDWSDDPAKLETTVCYLLE